MSKPLQHYVGNGSSLTPTSRPSVIFTYSPSFPGMHPFTEIKFLFGSILYTYTSIHISIPTSRFCTVQFLLPILPGIFFPLNVLPGSYVSRSVSTAT